MAVVDRQRFDVRMPKELADQLDSIENLTGYSRGEIFRRAIALYKEAKDVERENGKILFRNAEGETSQIVGLGLMTQSVQSSQGVASPLPGEALESGVFPWPRAMLKKQAIPFPMGAGVC